MIEDQHAFCTQLSLKKLDNLRVEIGSHILFVFPLAICCLEAPKCEPVLVKRQVVYAWPRVRDRDLYC